MPVMQTVKAFVDQKLYGLIPWSSVAFGDVKGDTGLFTIQGKTRTYSLSITSSYSHPPLGEIVFLDKARPHEIRGPVQDGTWHHIEQYIRLAEAGFPNEPPKFTAGGVITWDGVTPAAVVIEQEIRRQAQRGGVIERVPGVDPAGPDPGPVVRYTDNPGAIYANGIALVTKRNDDGTLNLTVFSDGHSEPTLRNNVRRQSKDNAACTWEPLTLSPATPLMEELLADYERMKARLEAAEDSLAGLQEQIAGLRQKRGPGRPSKAELAARTKHAA